MKLLTRRLPLERKKTKIKTTKLTWHGGYICGVGQLGYSNQTFGNAVLTRACYGQKTAVTFSAFPLRGRKSRQPFFAADAGVIGFSSLYVGLAVEGKLRYYLSILSFKFSWCAARSSHNPVPL